jgi:small conductance mechanosensitive channel
MGQNMSEMPRMDLNAIKETIVVQGRSFVLKLVGAVVLWLIGRWLIHLVIPLLVRALNRESLDPTLMNFLSSTLSVLFNITLVVALLGPFGVQIATFAALLAGVGLAIGAAWSGLLSNFASGAWPVLTVCPYCENQHYSQVYFDVNKTIQKAFTEAGFLSP